MVLRQTSPRGTMGVLVESVPNGVLVGGTTGVVVELFLWEYLLGSTIGVLVELFQWEYLLVVLWEHLLNCSY